MRGGGGEKTCSALQLKKANAKMNKGGDMLLFEALHKRCREDKRIDGVAKFSEFTVLLLIHVTWR